MRKLRYISVLSVVVLMIGLSAGMVLGADRRGRDDGDKRVREHPRAGRRREGRDHSDRRAGREDREQPSRLRRILHVKGLPPLRNEGFRPVSRFPIRDRNGVLRYRRLHRPHYKGRTVYYLSFGYTRPRYYAHFYYGYPLVPRRDAEVKVYVLPDQKPYTQKDYKILEPKGKEMLEEVYASELSPMLGGPETMSPEFALAEDALREGMLGLAVQDFRKLALDNPDDPVLMLALGLTLFARGDLEDAAAALRAGLAVVPDPEAVRFDEPFVFGTGNTYELRIQEVATGLEEHPDNADLQFLMGLHYFGRGEYAEAVEHLRKAEALDPADVASARLRALSMGHIAEAEKAAANPVAPADATTE